MKFFAHLNTAVQVIGQYKGQQPFGIFIKDFFRQDKKYGSRDRKNISHLCYCYFRLGKGYPLLTVEERIVAGLFLCSATPNEMLAQLKPAWNDQAGLPVEEKFSFVNAVSSSSASGAPDAAPAIFPWKDALSAGIDHEAFSGSFLVQPHLFLRIRPGKEKMVQQKLDGAGISYGMPAPHCIALANASKIDEVIRLNKEGVIQDYSSQRVGEFLQPELLAAAPGVRVWDCCAASGGKSILAWDVLGSIDLTVSDIRESIIANLKKRFAEAGITKYRSFVADLGDPQATLQLPVSPQLIIADVPCSGSGTWSRTPEQLYYFEPAAIARYRGLQQKIVSRVIEKLAPGGHFLYITCSVFREENEEVVSFIQQHFGLAIVKMELLRGYDQQADTMFAALLKKD
ncbi:Fmu (Sun) domain-containing protein [Paraflavitalea soli]|uniref:Fmu (Sun) domain-containing protein n=1 Tax=Paraflavitalea soli TaxID=2315862 RepID=A0A3B7MML4_9BACT|nr:Fmu (Sun) domain-containing protein [Paraflavitalea soli]AXY75754.1 Fmu (Sun) domain-containing protein [Paraflavitalea soli]